jgi:hypothetical protein
MFDAQGVISARLTAARGLPRLRPHDYRIPADPVGHRARAGSSAASAVAVDQVKLDEGNGEENDRLILEWVPAAESLSPRCLSGGRESASVGPAAAARRSHAGRRLN